MKDAHTGNEMKTTSKTDWARVRGMSDAEVHAAIGNDADARATNKAFWKDAKVVMPRHKKVVTMRLDADLLDWFRQESKYQTRINAILRGYMQSHENKHV